LYAIALAARDETELLKLEHKLQRHGVAHRAIREPDRNDELMAIGVEPGKRNTLKQYFKKYSLIK